MSFCTQWDIESEKGEVYKRRWVRQWAFFAGGKEVKGSEGKGRQEGVRWLTADAREMESHARGLQGLWKADHESVEDFYWYVKLKACWRDTALRRHSNCRYVSCDLTAAAPSVNQWGRRVFCWSIVFIVQKACMMDNCVAPEGIIDKSIRPVKKMLSIILYCEAHYPGFS